MYIKFCSKLATRMAAGELARKNYQDLAKLMEAAYNGGARLLAGNIFEQMFIDCVNSPDVAEKCTFAIRSLPVPNSSTMESQVEVEHSESTNL